MSTRALVIGLDGLDLGVVERFGAECLPNLYRVMNHGAYAALESVQPPATLPNWTTFLTGLDPARHGVFDFTTRRGYQVRFTAGTAREAPTVFQRLDRLGLRCACLSFPATWPPEELTRGVFVSGWDAPVAFEADRSFMWPRSLYEETVARFGTPTFDDVDEFHADAPGWIDRLPEALVRRVAKKQRWAQWLLERQDWDLFAVYFGESDTASHYLWAHHDPGSPRRPRRVSRDQSSGVLRVYQALDETVGRLIEAAGSQTEVTLLSDHGSGGSSDKVLYLNRLLAEHGLLSFKGRNQRGGAWLKELALRRLPPRLRERVFRIGNAWLPSRLESHLRFGAIDMERTTAFSDELNYFPGIYLNMAGREPKGTVRPDEKHETILHIRTVLLALRDPWTGRPVFRDVLRREELFEGPYLERAPDLLLDFHLDGDYSYNLMPSATAPNGDGPWRILTDQEKVGKKGRSLPGSHRPHGFLAIAGPRVGAVGRIDAHIADVTATLLARLGVAVPSSFRGRVLWNALEASDVAEALPEGIWQRSSSRGNEAAVEARLRELGYVE
ncbi:MAG: alkaline phosphatase family protein [Myxococcales bacterium]|nr:alkaline phosphatase family protein [Myxococcales bacterium]